jgi:hypothetical protein
MGRMYTCTGSGSVVAEMDLFEITAPATAVVILHEIHMSQSQSEISEQLPVEFYRITGSVTPGSGGSTGSSVKLGGVLDAAAATVIKLLNTTDAEGTFSNLKRVSENVLNGWHWVFTPETRIVIPPSGVVAAHLGDTPSITYTFNIEITYEEIG